MTYVLVTMIYEDSENPTSVRTRVIGLYKEYASARAELNQQILDFLEMNGEDIAQVEVDLVLFDSEGEILAYVDRKAPTTFAERAFDWIIERHEVE
jgi:hypothetical protein